ncbi:hypothetical protein MKEN_00668200 [Mycena kentingensis (nom. inval.)]|nr:hypothetical protein MKEN_00668200 [Mycena kentingensis (nom. inval.)]
MIHSAVAGSAGCRAVEVNQRALIDKVLARYSGEFTVFRELLQNSDDAQSKSVEIHFESTAETGEDGKLPDLKTALCQQWVFRNDGIPFRKEDWDRLKKIAEGNPDEDKIGAFGVGFYSLFSITEIPLVKSGNEWMGFYWRDNKESCFTVLCYCRDLIHAQDQLYARRGVLPEATNYTSFEMPLREPMPMPMAFDFARFLCSSITFMTHLAEVSVYFNKDCLVRLHKQSLPLKSLGLPKGLKGSSPTGHMLITGLNSRPVDIQATIMRWVYAAGSVKPKPIVRPQEKTGGSILSWFGLAGTPQRVATPLPPPPEEPLDLLSTIQTSVSLSIFSADVSVRLDKTSVTELHRATKKNPPTKLKYELIYTAKDQYDASKQEDQQQSFATGSVFQGLRADLDGEGSTRIFIGHATGQTTGLAGHMSARFIPTVERESIDLMDRHVASWNRDLLWVGGYLSRAAYEREFDQIGDEWTAAIKPGSPLDKVAELRKLEARSLHTLRFMTFHPSTPSAEVSQLLQNAFFECGPRHFLLMSTVGVREASAIRYPDPTFAFLKDLPRYPV